MQTVQLLIFSHHNYTASESFSFNFRRCEVWEITRTITRRLMFHFLQTLLSTEGNLF